MRNIPTTTWVSAGRSSPRPTIRTRASICPGPRLCAASSRCRRCAISRSPRRTSTTAVFQNLHQVIEWYVTRDINNDTANNPNPVAAGPGGNPYMAAGTFYLTAIGSARPLRVQRPAGGVRRQRQCRRGALHAAHVRRRTGADAHGAGDRRHRGVSLHADRRLRSDQIVALTTYPRSARPLPRRAPHKESADEDRPTPDSNIQYVRPCWGALMSFGSAALADQAPSEQQQIEALRRQLEAVQNQLKDLADQNRQLLEREQALEQQVAQSTKAPAPNPVPPGACRSWRCKSRQQSSQTRFRRRRIRLLRTPFRAGLWPSPTPPHRSVTA